MGYDIADYNFRFFFKISAIFSAIKDTAFCHFTKLLKLF